MQDAELTPSGAVSWTYDSDTADATNPLITVVRGFLLTAADGTYVVTDIEGIASARFVTSCLILTDEDKAGPNGVLLDEPGHHRSG